MQGEEGRVSERSVAIQGEEDALPSDIQMLKRQAMKAFGSNNIHTATDFYTHHVCVTLPPFGTLFRRRHLLVILQMGAFEWLQPYAADVHYSDSKILWHMYRDVLQKTCR